MLNKSSDTTFYDFSFPLRFLNIAEGPKTL